MFVHFGLTIEAIPIGAFLRKKQLQLCRFLSTGQSGVLRELLACWPHAMRRQCQKTLETSPLQMVF